MKQGKLTSGDEAVPVEYDLQTSPKKLTLTVLPIPGGQLETNLNNRMGVNLVTDEGSTYWIECTKWDGIQIEFTVKRPMAGFL